MRENDVSYYSELSDDEATVMRLKAQGLSYNEISKRLGVSIYSINQKISRATLKLMEQRGVKNPALSLRERQMLDLLESGINRYDELKERLQIGRNRIKALIWNLKRKGWISKHRIDTGAQRRNKKRATNTPPASSEAD